MSDTALLWVGLFFFLACFIVALALIVAEFRKDWRRRKRSQRVMGD
jgi:threonine/homoserine/homoserine lactone efflux protein